MFENVITTEKDEADAITGDLLQQDATSFISYQSKAVVNSHKQFNADNLSELQLKLIGADGSIKTLLLNNNNYETEVKFSGSMGL